MADARNTNVSARKAPRQARANVLIAAVLDAAVQVLRSEGAARFTTARVAERAGVSVGSIYQYFPNKASILFRLQADEWRRTTELMRDILEDFAAPWPDRVRRLVHAFLRSECEEAQIRLALGDAAPLYRDAPEASEARQGGSDIIRAFIDETLPKIAPVHRGVVAELFEETLTQVGSSFSQIERAGDEIDTYSCAMADMLNAYLVTLAG